MLKRAVIAFTFLGLTCASTQAQQRIREVRFAPGAHAAELRGTISGRGEANFGLRAVDGQVMQVLFSPSRGACYVNAYEPGSATAAHIGSVAGNEFGRSPTKAGQYRFQVYLMRSAARRGEVCRYRLSIELTGGVRNTAPSASNQQLRQGCLAEAARQYGVASGRIRLGAIRNGPEGPFIDGTANKGAEGVKKLRCRFDADRKLRDVMAMTPDGE